MDAIHTPQSACIYIGVSDWSSRHGISRAWACRLCVAGRVNGAVFVDGRWQIPEGAGLPARIVSVRVVERHEAAMRRAGGSEVRGVWLNEDRRDAIRSLVDAGHVFTEHGTSEANGKHYMPPSWWNAAAWVFYQVLRDAGGQDGA